MATAPAQSAAKAEAKPAPKRAVFDGEDMNSVESFRAYDAKVDADSANKKAAKQNIRRFPIP
ncbi:hypothetical protein [Microvirga alba]|uniref:Uncharacterized protein n=1 Tax=Microvirga alba TaxID=2791025 RepID=A0A931FP93_9HYPH|nr:hypothetical protein [Microvirga alba]MBF9234769.1 hypothetical protein [Microvirga alba]